MKATEIPLPESWPENVKRSMLYALQLAKDTMVKSRGWATYHWRREVRKQAKLDKSENEHALDQDLMRIIRGRYERIPARKRPYYTPVERMQILNHKIARGWNLKQTSDAFMVEEATISAWMKRIDEDGPNALVKIKESIHKYPDFLRYATREIKALIPLMGKKKIAEHFIRAGLAISASSIGRFIKSAKPEKPFMPDPDINPKEEIKVVTSRHPDHSWMLDLTVVPTHFGMWTLWKPNSLFQVWPFCWWVAVVIDHFSRKVMGIVAFPKQPTSEDIVEVLSKITKGSGKTPKYIISDKGMQFHPPKTAKHPENHPYRKWCRKVGIVPRYGAIGKYGSIAIIERFMKTLKSECTRKINIPMDIYQMQHELVLFVLWYNNHRPHAAFMKEQNKCPIMGARTPQEVYNNSPPVKPFEFRYNSEAPQVKIDISYFEGRKHLPIIEIKEAFPKFRKVA